MTSVDPRRAAVGLRRAAVVALALAAGAATVAPADADVVRVRQLPNPADAFAPRPLDVAAFGVAGSFGAPAGGAALSGVEGSDVVGLSASPDRSLVAAVTRDYGETTVQQAQLLPVAGGGARTLRGPDGRPLRDVAASPRRGDAWTSWEPATGALTLHRFDHEGGVVPWLPRAASRRCDAVTATCGAWRPEDVVALPGGGAVRISASATSEPGVSAHPADRIAGGGTVGRWVRDHADRPVRVRVRVTGRRGAGQPWTATGSLRRGAPAYDRAHPGAAGVLVRTVVLRADRAGAVGPREGPAVVVDAGGAVRAVKRLRGDVLGALPDGRWVLARPREYDLGAGPAGQPLRTIDPQGRTGVLRSGGRVITPLWAAFAAGLPDEDVRSAHVRDVGVDSDTGLLVLVLAHDDHSGGLLGRKSVVAVPLDGSAPPRIVERTARRRGGDATDDPVAAYVVR